MSYTAIQTRRDTAATWTQFNPILALGELGFETNTGKAKIGNGTTAWNSLPYVISTYWDDIQQKPSYLTYLSGLSTNVQQKFNDLDNTISGLSGGTSGVTSINGQTGVVTLTASDVGAASTSHTHTQYASTSHTHSEYLKLGSVNNDTTGIELTGSATAKHLFHVDNTATTGYSHAISGFSDATSGNGVIGSTRSTIDGGVYGIYANGPNGTTFTTYGRIGTQNNAAFFYGANVTVSGGSFSPFTGSHFCLTSSSQEMTIGDIVSNTQSILLDVNDSISIVQLSNTAADKNVIGIVAKKDAYDSIESFSKNFKVLMDHDENGRPILSTEGTAFSTEHSTKSNLIVNALGEGGINVCAENGDIERGDYLCSSTVPGKGAKQADDILRSSTVAKALEGVIWANETVGVNGCFLFNGVKCKMISCTYHCG